MVNCSIRCVLALVAFACAMMLSSNTHADAIKHAKCAPLKGADLVVQRTEKFVLMGELHGTAEIPALFFDLVCHAAQSGSVEIGLEIQDIYSPAFEAYLRASDGAAAKTAFLQSEHWTYGIDGRGSVAMLKLIDDLIVLKKSGFPIDIFVFSPTPPRNHSITDREKMMAVNWMSRMKSRPNARMFALVGNYHSSKFAFRGGEPAALHLPPSDTLTLEPQEVGGESWNCIAKGCGANAFGGPNPGPRGIYPSSSRARDVADFEYSVGKHYTASHPASLDAIKNMPPPAKPDRSK